MTPNKPMLTSPYPNSIVSKTSCWRTSLLFAFCSVFLLACGGGANDSALDIAVKNLESELASERIAGLEGLIAAGSKAKEHASKAVPLLSDDKAKVRAAAIRVVVKFKHATEEVTAALVSIVENDSDVQCKVGSFNALKELGEEEKFVEACAAALTKGNAELKENAAMALAQSENPVPKAQDALIAGCDDKSAVVRMSCVTALGNLGVDASDAAKAKIKALEADADADVKEAAKEALANLK